MNRSIHTMTRVLVLLVLLVCVTFAGGYQLNEHGARAVGMGGAFVATASDPSAVFYNPAGLAFQSGINVMGGGTLIIPSTQFTPAPGTILYTETKTLSNVFFPPNLYGTYALDNKWVAGIGVYSPYGLGTEWPTDWQGGSLAVNSQVTTFYVTPTISYKVMDNLSLGLGASFVYGKVSMSHRVTAFSALTAVGGGFYAPTVSTTPGTVNLDGTATGFGFDVGVMYKPITILSVGVSFRSETKLNFSGTATFSGMQASAPYFPGGDGKASLPMPMNLWGGIAFTGIDRLTIEGDLQYIDWTVYKDLSITLPAGPPINLVVAGPTFMPGYVMQASTTYPKNWDKGYIFRLGGEYTLNDQLALRLGGIYDYTPQPNSKIEPMLPDANRLDLTAGAGMKLNEHVSVDVAYMIVLFSNRSTSTAPLAGGTYESIANLFAVDISYKF